MRDTSGAKATTERQASSKRRAAKHSERQRAKPLTWIAVNAARYWQFTLALWIGLLAAGGYAYFDGLDREGFPAIDTPYALVNANYFADDPEVVDTDVAAPLSQSLLVPPPPMIESAVW